MIKMKKKIAIGLITVFDAILTGIYGYDGNGSESKESLTPKLVRSRRQLLQNQNCLKLYFKLAIFSTHTPQILGSIFKLREIINLKPVKLVGIRPMPMQ